MCQFLILCSHIHGEIHLFLNLCAWMHCKYLVFSYFQPFWRVWHPPGSDGRGVIGTILRYLLSKFSVWIKLLIILHFSIAGVLEADFVEPAHDKQSFERTTVLSRLEARLIQMQKNYWSVFYFIMGPSESELLFVLLYFYFWGYSNCVHYLFRSSNCHKIGYAPRRNKKVNERGNRKGLMFSYETKISKMNLIVKSKKKNPR